MSAAARLPSATSAPTSSPSGASDPSAEITKFDVLEVINAKKRSGAPQMARALLVLIRRFFNWCLDQHTFGLDRSPCDRLKPNKLIGAVPKRNRRLSDAELVRVLASHRADEIPGWSGLSHAAAHRVAAQRGRAAIVAGGLRRHHHRPAGAHEGQGWQGGRTSGAAVVGGARGHRIAAAHQERASSCSR